MQGGLILKSAVYCWRFVPASLLLLLVFILGCGHAGPPRYHVSGTVTYQGKPVPVGSILFQPDPSQGNSGAYGNAMIKDGKFDTRVDGEPPIGGPQLVIIEAFDGKNTTDLTPYGNSLTSGYQEKYDLPDKDTTLDIELTRPRPSAL
jgi:hypothetical protein